MSYLLWIGGIIFFSTLCLLGIELSETLYDQTFFIDKEGRLRKKRNIPRKYKSKLLLSIIITFVFYLGILSCTVYSVNSYRNIQTKKCTNDHTQITTIYCGNCGAKINNE